MPEQPFFHLQTFLLLTLKSLSWIPKAWKVSSDVPANIQSPQSRAAVDQSLAGSFAVLFISLFLLFALPQNGKEGYEKWRVENSWGDDRGNKGEKMTTLHL